MYNYMYVAAIMIYTQHTVYTILQLSLIPYNFELEMLQSGS